MEKQHLGPAVAVPNKNITIKLAQLIDSRDALEKVFNQDLPVRMAYKISKIIKAVNNELTTFDEFRNKLLNKYGTDAGEGKFSISAENVPLFQEDIKSLLETEVTLEFNRITLDDLGSIKLSSRDLSTLDYLIVEE